MIYFYLIPEWFYAFAIAMEILFGIITFAVAAYSLKIYKISKEKNIEYFGLGFILIGLSYLTWALTNILIAFDMNSGIKISSLNRIVFLGNAGIYLHMMFFIAGLVVIACTTFNVKKGSIYYLTLGLGLIAVVSALNKVITFRILSVFILSFITYHYFFEYINNENKNTRLVLIAFFLLLIGSTDFVFSPMYIYSNVIGHFIELGAYLLILIGLIRAIRR